MDLRDLIRVARRQMAVLVAATIIGLCGGLIYSMLTPERYQASVQLMITVDTADASTTGELNLANSYAVQVAESYRAVLNSTLVLRPVIEDLGLGYTAGALASKVTTSLAPRGVIITATVSDGNPGQAARIANAIGESFSTVIADQVERRDEATAYTVKIVTVQPASVPVTPAAPNVPLSITLGAILGLAVGIGLALLRTVLDRRIRTLDDVDKAVDAPVIGGVPFDATSSSRPLAVTSDPHDPRAEAYRTIRTNLRFLFPPNEVGVFVVTSAGPSEGKSTTAANLAIALSESGYRVALIDADLRKPRVAGLFGVEGTIGLTDVLVGRVSISDVMQRWGRGTLFLLPAGTRPPNPAEMLGSSAMEMLVLDLKAAFDVVIIDAPPVLPVTDAAVISRIATGVLLVAAAGATTTDHLSAAAERIHTADSRVLGTIITMLPTRGADKTAYGRYGYSAAHAGSTTSHSTHV
ncbi:succinoglycan biosynthesis transport protein ExoP [Microbacterium sp. W4I4]|uniref:polysaccharide biosynthesis tyrosine autokinase n=1 Tax=Microbacterium sp. W4I4 TaxID=3042295 RepID=UPI002788E596|nr:polysaccharide biosynthesis tyrosine autokinase [Microbacterium sp. W4I4]MDQ0613802.1 succinoglycan biosynthesis transport protein ExoP [Microbacterium sp. W4I4]